MDPAPFHLRGAAVDIHPDGSADVEALFRDPGAAKQGVADGTLSLRLVGAEPHKTVGVLGWRVLPGPSVLMHIEVEADAIDQAGKPKRVTHRIPVWLQRSDRKTYPLDPESDLTAQVLAAPDGSVLDGQGHTWRETLDLRDRHGLVLRDVGLSVDRGRGFRLRGCSDITLEGCNVTGSHREGEGGYEPSDHAYAVEGCQRIRVLECAATGVWGDFVYVGSEINKAGHGLFSNIPSHDVLVEDFDFYSCGRQGFGITSADQLVIRNGRVGDVGRTLIDVEPGHVFDPVKDVTVQGLELTGVVRNNLLAMHGSAYHVQDITVQDLDAGEHAAIRVSVRGNSERKGLTLRGIRSDRVLGNPHPAVHVRGWEDVTIEDCHGVMDSRRANPFARLENCWRYQVRDVSTRDARSGPGDPQERGHTVDLEAAWWDGHPDDGEPFRVVHVDRGVRTVLVGDPDADDPTVRPGGVEPPDPEPDPPDEPDPDPPDEPEPDPQPDPEPVPVPWWLRLWRAILRWLGLD